MARLALPVFIFFLAVYSASAEDSVPPEVATVRKTAQGFRDLRQRMYERGRVNTVRVLDEKIALTEAMEPPILTRVTLNHRRNVILLEMKKLEPDLKKETADAKRKMWDLEEELVGVNLDLIDARTKVLEILKKLDALSLEAALRLDKEEASKKTP